MQGCNFLIALAVCLHANRPNRKPVGIAIAYAATLWEGLLGGATYVNAFTLLSTNTPVEHRYGRYTLVDRKPSIWFLLLLAISL